jgi:hypothetical protein
LDHPSSLSHESFLPDAFCLLKFLTAPDSAERTLRGEILKPVDLIGACLFGPASLASPEQCPGIAQIPLNPAFATFHPAGYPSVMAGRNVA